MAAILDFIKCDNSVANRALVLKFDTVLVITEPNIFHYLISIEMLTFFLDNNEYWQKRHKSRNFKGR